MKLVPPTDIIGAQCRGVRQNMRGIIFDVFDENPIISIVIPYL